MADHNTSTTSQTISVPQQVSSGSSSLSVPKEYFQYVGPAEKAGNSLYRCKKCSFGGQQKSISCVNTSRQNLKKHIAAVHPSCLTKFNKLCDELRQEKCGAKRHSEQLHENNSGSQLKQTKLESCSVLTQQQLDSFVVDYIVDSVLSVHHVNTDSFRRLIHQITQGRLYPACRQTVTKQLEERFKLKKRELKDTLCSVNRVCTTADCWTSRRRSFLGITVHWLDNHTLSRKAACLAVRQLKGKHTYDVIAKTLEEIFEEYELQNKICFTVTDSGSNFIKAFRLFSVDESEDSSVEMDQNGEDNSDDSDIQYQEMDETLNPTSSADDDQILYHLPAHWKCACHLLSLVATSDCAKIDDPLYKRTSVQTFSKLTALWNKQNRSVVASEKIKDSLGMLLVTPGETRWNSMYDAVTRVYNILCVSDMEVKFDKLCDELDIKRLQPVQKTFVKEYVAVMKPVCYGLDILQGETKKDIGLGFLLPTLVVMKAQLKVFLDQGKNDRLVICSPLASCLLNAIDRRFSNMFDSIDAQLASVVHPKFKLDWIDDDLQRSHLIEALKRRVSQSLLVAPTDDQKATSAVADGTDNQPDFFAGLSARRHRVNDSPNVNQEINNYLADTSDSIASLDAYPHIRKKYIDLNTGLPSSAAVERLFSLGGRVFSPLRSRLSSAHFEMVTFLRLAKW